MDKVLELKECDRCKQAIAIVQAKDGREVARDVISGSRHVCWNLPADANLLVLDD